MGSWLQETEVNGGGETEIPSPPSGHGKAFVSARGVEVGGRRTPSFPQSHALFCPGSVLRPPTHTPAPLSPALFSVTYYEGRSLSQKGLERNKAQLPCQDRKIAFQRTRSVCIELSPHRAPCSQGQQEKQAWEVSQVWLLFLVLTDDSRIFSARRLRRSA